MEHENTTPDAGKRVWTGKEWIQLSSDTSRTGDCDAVWMLILVIVTCGTLAAASYFSSLTKCEESVKTTAQGVRK